MSANGDLRQRRDILADQLAELQWDLGGLAYEMAIRDHFRLDVLTRQAARLQKVDAELGEVERMLRLDQAGAAGACAGCGALYAQRLGLLLAVREGPDTADGPAAGGGENMSAVANRILRSFSLVVTDRRWAAPLSAMALGFGLFVGVAIGPDAAGTMAGTPLVVELPAPAEEPSEVEVGGGEGPILAGPGPIGGGGGAGPIAALPAPAPEEAPTARGSAASEEGADPFPGRRKS